MSRSTLLTLCVGLGLTATVGCQGTGGRTARIDRPGPAVVFTPDGRPVGSERRDASDSSVQLASRTASVEEAPVVRTASAERIPLPQTDVDATVDIDAAPSSAPAIGSF